MIHGLSNETTVPAPIRSATPVPGHVPATAAGVSPFSLAAFVAAFFAFGAAGSVADAVRAHVPAIASAVQALVSLAAPVAL